MILDEFLPEASGYIPKNKKEAHDPRWEMALTNDVHQNQGTKEAKKFNFKLDKNGQPPYLRSNGKINEYVYKPQENPAFKAWFGNSKVVNSDGSPKVVYHGTTHDFTSFSMSRGNKENYHGVGYYFTSSQHDVGKNYANKGPDLRARIANRADQIIQQWEDEDDELDLSDNSEFDHYYKAAQKQAEKELMGSNLGMVMPCYLRIINPVVIKRKGGTWFEYYYHEKTGKESGSYIKLYNAFQYVADSNNLDLNKLWSVITENIGPEFTAFQFEEKMRNFASDYSDELYNLGGVGTLLGLIYQKMGFDGIILEGAASVFGQYMDMGSNAYHYVVWKSTQIKSALGNIGTFNPRSKKIVESAANEIIKVGKTKEQIMPLIDDILRNRLYVPTYAAQEFLGACKKQNTKYEISTLAVMYIDKKPISWVIKWMPKEIKWLKNIYASSPLSHPKASLEEDATYWRYTKPAYRHMGIYHKLKDAINKKPLKEMAPDFNYSKINRKPFFHSVNGKIHIKGWIRKGPYTPFYRRGMRHNNILLLSVHWTKTLH